MSLKARLVKQLNPDVKIIPFTGLAHFSNSYQERFNQGFLPLHPEYTYSDIESVYLHYKCDVSVNNVLVKGCNLINSETGECSGTPANGCSASSALGLSESRVPNTNPSHQQDDWKEANYNSPVYKEFGIWRINEILSFYEISSDGIWWDNILYYGGFVKQIEDTIEYFGIPDRDNHPRNSDYNSYYLYVKQRLQQQNSNLQIFIGNVNGMYWIRQDGPYTQWVLNNLQHFTPEGWLTPLSVGEQYMPSWVIHCPDVKEVWDYTSNHQNAMHVLTYNYPLDSNSDNTKAFSIAKYYLVKNSRLYYGYTENKNDNIDFPYEEWNDMAEVNIGFPKTNPQGVKDFDGQTNTNKFFNWLNPNLVLSCDSIDDREIVVARHYDNGLVIARWKANRCSNSGPLCNSYVDPKIYSLTNPYGASYYIIQPDGTISQDIVNSVTLRTNEAALVLQVCPEGPVSSTCGCNGIINNPGDICFYDSNITGGNRSNASNESGMDDFIIFQCKDSVDNDGDGFADFPLDPGCDNENDNDEIDFVYPPSNCYNGCEAGELKCLSETSYERCGHYDDDFCLEISDEIKCDEGYLCKENKGCVLKGGGGPYIFDGIFSDKLTLYALGASAFILLMMFVWLVFRRLLRNIY